MNHIIDKLWKTPVSFIAGDLVGLFVVPIALLFCKKEDEHLPHWAYLWCNEWDGINGRSNDDAWLKRFGEEGVRKYWPRFLWLAIRNRGSNLSQMLGKKNPAERETWSPSMRIPFTKRRFKCRWGYTSYYPGEPGPPEGNSFKIMPKKNFTMSISIRRLGD